jgi:hypothetical protein
VISKRFSFRPLFIVVFIIVARRKTAPTDRLPPQFSTASCWENHRICDWSLKINFFRPRRARQSNSDLGSYHEAHFFFVLVNPPASLCSQLHLCVKLCINSFLCSGHFQDTLLLSVAEDQARMNTRWPLHRRNWRIGFPDELSRRAPRLLGGEYKHCHSAILVYLYYTRNAGI